MPCVVPAITAMTTTPIAQRETESVTRSQTPSQRSSSPGISTLASARFRWSMSVSRKRQMKRIVKQARKTPKKPPAIPSTAEIASGAWIDDLLRAFLDVPAAAPRRATTARPTSCSCCDRLRQVVEEVADAADERHEQQQPEHGHRDARCRAR